MLAAKGFEESIVRFRKNAIKKRAVTYWKATAFLILAVATVLVVYKKLAVQGQTIFNAMPANNKVIQDAWWGALVWNTGGISAQFFHRHNKFYALFTDTIASKIKGPAEKSNIVLNNLLVPRSDR